MSQFHWHIVDSQSFPLVVAEFPELSQKGAYSPSQVYSNSDVDDIVKYAGAVSYLSSQVVFLAQFIIFSLRGA